VAGFSVEQRALVDELERQRGRIAAVARLLLDRGLRGEAVALEHIEETIADVAARLAI
jgi:Ni,Fe-hydrogenase III large subunit